MKPFFACLLLALTLPIHAGDFALLSKAEVKAFEASFQSIEDAFKDRNLSPIASFGPSILNRYSALLLQSDSWAKRQRPAYQKLDSLVAYAIVRRRVDSVLTLPATQNPSLVDLQGIRQMDRLLPALVETSNLCLLDAPYCDSTATKVRSILETGIPACIRTLKARGQQELAYQALTGLNYDSKALKEATRSLESDVEKAFRIILSSYDRESVLAFRSKYPTYKPDKIQERLNSLEADELYHLLKDGTRSNLVQYMEANPASVFAPEVRKKLEPELLQAALVQFDPGACRMYLALFPPGTDSWKKVSETLAWMMTPASDSVATQGVGVRPPEVTLSESGVPRDDGRDGPRTPPLPEGYSPLVGQELNRMGAVK